MTVFRGFEELLIEERMKTSAYGGRSFLPYAKHTGEEYTLISLSQYREDGKKWTEEETISREGDLRRGRPGTGGVDIAGSSEDSGGP